MIFYDAIKFLSLQHLWTIHLKNTSAGDESKWSESKILSCFQKGRRWEIQSSNQCKKAGKQSWPVKRRKSVTPAFLGKSEMASDPFVRVTQGLLTETLNAFYFILAACLVLNSSFTEWKEMLFKGLWRTLAPFFAKKSPALFQAILHWAGLKGNFI